jgi:hypothetical protein
LNFAARELSLHDENHHAQLSITLPGIFCPAKDHNQTLLRRTVCVLSAEMVSERQQTNDEL